MEKAEYYGSVKSVSEVIEILSNLGLTRKAHSHKRVWYRGHSDQEWKLHPQVYRKDFLPSSVPVGKEEEFRLQKERHLSQDFRVLSASIHTTSRTDAELYFMQQHYGMPTRLLDWTISPLAGLYFATNGNVDRDGVLYVMDAYKFTKKVRRLTGGIATSRNKIFSSALSIIFEWKDNVEWGFGVLPIRPDHIDIRIGLQRSCFTFHGPECPVITNDSEVNGALGYMVIPREHKDNMKKQLQLLGIDEFSIFGDLESLAKKLRASYTVSDTHS